MTYRAKTKITFAALAVLALTLTLAVSSASAKSIVDYFGTDPLIGQGTLGGEFRLPGGVAVNQTGAGPADEGDVYVVDRGFGSASPDRRNHRIQRFSRDDNGTPAFPYDDTWTFISAWGADVVQDGGVGDRGDAADANYEICTVTAQCKEGVSSGGNGTAEGNGTLSFPSSGGVAVDQDTGNVYVLDSGNARVNVYEGDGTFIRSFGFDVIDSGGEEPAPNERQELTVTATGGRFALTFRDDITGARGNGTTNNGSKVIAGISTDSGAFEAGQTLTGTFIGNGILPPGTMIDAIDSGANTLTVSQAATLTVPASSGGVALMGFDLDFDATAQEVEDALNSLPSLGDLGGSVDVTGTNPYTIEFGGTLGGDDVPAIETHAGGLGGASPSAAVTTTQTGGAYEVCEEADDDICAPGAPGAAAGQIGSGAFEFQRAQGIAVSPPDSNPATGVVFVADTVNRRVGAYDLDGSAPGSFGSAAEFASDQPEKVAVDSRGIVYASDSQNFNEIERYDTEDANGGGIGFLAPIPGGVNEEQQFRVNATSGTFKLRFGPDTTVDLPFDAPANDPGTPAIDSVREALEALPSLAPGDVRVSGGPGNGAGSAPYTVSFDGALRFTDVPSQIESLPGATPLDGGSGVNLMTLVNGSTERDEQLEIFVHSTSGNYKLRFGSETTGDVAFNAPATGGGSVQAALEALPSINPGDVSVSGGPGNAIASSPYVVTFTGALGRRDISGMDTAPGTTPLDGGAGTISYTTQEGQVGFASGATSALAVDPDTDGGGSDTDVLYVGRGNSGIQQLGPINRPGEAAPPTTADADHGAGQIFAQALAIDDTSGHLYVPSSNAAVQNAHGVYVLHDAGSNPTASLDSLSDETATSVRANATIDPNGPPLVSYRFEHSTDGSRWTSFATEALGIQNDPQAVSETLSPPGSGFTPNTDYQIRLVVTKKFAPPIITAPLAFRTAPDAPDVETTGAPHRTTTTAQLNGRVNPRGSAATFRFQYVTEEAFSVTGFTDLSSGGQTAAVSAGSDDLIKLAAAEITGLDPSTEYRYRITADNGSPGSPVFGQPMAVRTRATEELPNQNRAFPGPPDSDRAWEQVSLAESNGNPVLGTRGFSDDGDRAAYAIGGGTDIGDRGSAFSFYYSERNETAPHQGDWGTQFITPPAAELVGDWFSVIPNPNLTAFVGTNSSFAEALASFWRFGPGIAPTRLVDFVPPTKAFDNASGGLLASEDISLVLTPPLSGGALDPAFPGAALRDNVYDVSEGAGPKLASLLPGERVAACGVDNETSAFRFSTEPEARLLSADGSRLYFPSQDAGPCGEGGAPTQLYQRDLLAGETKLISSPPLSGLTCPAGFIRSTDTAAYFWTQTSLDSDDTAPANCGSGSNGPDFDIYRYDVATEALACLTCLVPGLDADVFSPSGQVLVSDDDSRVYFRAGNPLLPGASPNDAYLLRTDTEELVHLGLRPGPISGSGVQLGARSGNVEATADGSVLYFRAAEAELNPLGDGADNGGTRQWYRYDDNDRSIVCVSCPTDGSAPGDDVDIYSADQGPRNHTPLSADGDVFAFRSEVSLLDPDQNTSAANPPSGADVYEWRDGRLILITDGITEWSPRDFTGQPLVMGVSPDGGDVFFLAAAQLTPDAMDGFLRLYTARIGGGFSFPEPDPPCPLEVCQGTPRGAPDDPVPSSESFSGRGNPSPEPQSCAPDTRAAKSLSKQAARFQKMAARIAKTNPRRAKTLRAKARLKARAAKQKSRAARSCRQANREATR